MCVVRIKKTKDVYEKLMETKNSVVRAKETRSVSGEYEENEMVRVKNSNYHLVYFPVFSNITYSTSTHTHTCLPIYSEIKREMYGCGSYSFRLDV